MQIDSGPRRPQSRQVVRHVVDAAAAPVAFVVVNHQQGARWAALAALLVAVAIAALRRHRGEPLAVVAASTAFVALHSASALAVGEGRAFFLPELAINGAGLVLCGLSLLVGRPLTGPVCRKLGLEAHERRAERDVVRRHWRLTVAWTALWAIHIVPLTLLYAIDSVVGLTALGTFFNKPTVLAMAIVTAVTVRRGAEGARTPTAVLARSSAAPVAEERA